MEMEKLIEQINHLAHKQKTIGLTEEEKKEQAKLRKVYIEQFRAAFKNQLNHTKIKTPDGKLHPLKYAPQSNKKYN